MSNYNNFSLNTEKYEVCLKIKDYLFYRTQKSPPDPAAGETFYKEWVQNGNHMLRIIFLLVL